MEKVELIGGDSVVLLGGNLISTLESIEKEYELSFDFYGSSKDKTWGNVLHFTTEDTNNCVYGHHIPTVDYGGTKLRIASAISGNSYYLKNARVSRDTWHTIKICQTSIKGEYHYSVTVDGKNVVTDINKQPQIFMNVKVYASSPWNKASEGKIRNMYIINTSGPKCAVCNEMFNEPKMLHCSHTFCEGCIQKLSQVDPIVCPTCEYTTQIADKDSLWTNFIIQKKVRQAKLRKSGKMLQCGECEKKTATEFCFDCRLKLCNSCSTHHKECTRYEGHKIENINNIPDEELLEPAIIMCARHKKNLSYYCEQCNASACFDCIHSKSHRGHSILLLDEWLDDEVKLLQQLIGDSALKHKEYEEVYLKGIEDFMGKFEGTREKSMDIVTHAYDKLIDTLQAEKENHLKCLNEKYSLFKLSLKGARDVLKVMNARISHLEEVMALPKEEVIEVLLKGRGWLNGIVAQMKDVLERKETESGNLFQIDDLLLTFHEICSVSSDIDKINGLLKEIKFETLTSQYQHQQTETFTGQF